MRRRRERGKRREGRKTIRKREEGDLRIEKAEEEREKR